MSRAHSRRRSRFVRPALPRKQQKALLYSLPLLASFLLAFAERVAADRSKVEPKRYVYLLAQLKSHQCSYTSVSSYFRITCPLFPRRTLFLCVLMLHLQDLMDCARPAAQC